MLAVHNSRVNSTSTPLVLPLTFPSISQLSPRQAGTSRPLDVVQVSCSSAEPSVLVSWGLSCSPKERDEADNLDNAPQTKGLIMGCKDGSFYIFHAALNPNNTLPTDDRNSETNESPSTSPFNLSRYSRQGSRSATPALQTPFHVPSRSRVVSGLSTEPVEAPKNYVDFEEEAGKLKDLLKGKASKDKSPPALQPTNGKMAQVVQSSPTPDNVNESLKRNNAPRSLLSATNTPSFTPTLLSTPPSPRLPRIPTNSAQLSLKCHTIPARSGPENPITGMNLVDNNRLLVTLHFQGELSVFRTLDGACLWVTHVDNLSHPSVPSAKRFSHRTWRWTNLQIVHTKQHLFTAFLVHGKADNDIWSASLEADDNITTQKQTRLVMFECRHGDDYGSVASKLTKLDEWYFDGPVNGVGVKEDPDDTPVLVYINSKGNLVSRQSRPLPPFHLPIPPPHEHNAHAMSLPLPNPFKGIMSKSNENVSNIGEIKLDTDVAAPEERDMGTVFSKGFLDGVRTRVVGINLRGLAWSDQELVGFETDGNSQRLLFASSVTCIHDTSWVDDNHYTVIFVDRGEVYALIDANNDEMTSVPVSAARLHVFPRLVYSFALGSEQTVHYISPTEVLFTTVGQDRRREIQLAVTDSSASQISTLNSNIIWKASAPEDSDSSAKIQISSILPLEDNRIILGYDDGRLRQSALSLMTANPENPSTMAIITETAVDGYITAIYSLENDRTKEQFIIGGVDDGSICFWSLDSLQLCARWIVFTFPLHRIVQFQDEGPLRGCVLCISLDGTIAVIAIDGFQFLYLIPGSVSPLSRICLNGDNLLLIYKDIRTRMWGLRTKEFWRSMTIDKAEELITQEGWSIWSIEHVEQSTTSFRVIASRSQGLDSVSTIVLDLERFVSDATAIARSGAIGGTHNREGLLTLKRLRLALSILLTPSVCEDIDEICTEKLGITAASHVSVGFSSFDYTCVFDCQNGRDSWCISPEVSAARALSIVAILRVMALFEELTEGANTVMTFYATSLASAVGPSYQAPSPLFLAQRWFDGPNEIRQAARILFDSAITHLPDEDSSVLVEKLQHHLPNVQPAADRESLRSALALFICGHVAAQKYSFLSTSVLADTAKSITMYLHDEQSAYRTLAIDLSSRGFQVWQNYVDAMEILRAITMLATNNSKQGITTQNTSAHARLAVLHIVSSNTPLFMTTLSLDILHPRSVEHRKSVLQIFAFLIRKRPLVVYPNLPRLMEAVVKSLDPNSTASREAVLDTATEIIGHVVKTFPTVDFHMTSQRLAVGTNEGAIVMYDLKTATRLFVLEGHHKRLAACSFSGDGRRLVSVSLEEGVVLVWKVGSSFSSFFHPGAPPRQGSGGSSPFRTLSFNIGEAANLTIADTLEWVQFEWAADRSVKLKIKDIVLTFST